MRNLLQSLLDADSEMDWKSQLSCENGMETFFAPDFDGCSLSSISKSRLSVRKLILCIALQPHRCLFYIRWFTRKVFGGLNCFDKEGLHMYGLECNSLFVRQLFTTQPTKTPIHICCDDFGVDCINQLLSAGQLLGYHFNRSNVSERRILQPGNLQIAIRSIYELDSTRKDYSSFVEMVKDFIHSGGWIIVVDSHLNQANPGLLSLLTEINNADAVNNSLHPKFRLILVTNVCTNAVSDILEERTFVPQFVPNEIRLALDADHHSVCHSILRHYMNGFTYKPSNDRRIRKMYFSAAFFHATLCFTFPSTIESKCPYGNSDFQTLLHLISVFIDDSIKRSEQDTSRAFKHALSITYAGLDEAHFHRCVENIYGEDNDNIWPIMIPEKVAGNRISSLEIARGL
jgi:hypothetical protein